MFYCCKACYAHLEKININAAKSWCNLCETFINARGVFGIKEYLMPEAIPVLRLLEENGFVLSADAPEAVKFRVEGYALENDIHTFCVNRTHHKHSDDSLNVLL